MAWFQPWPIGPATFQDGLIHPELHDAMEKSMQRHDRPMRAPAGARTSSPWADSAKGMSYAEGADNCVAFFNRLKAQAEDKNVTVCMEVMNSILTPDTLGRLDQICDHVAWGVDVVKRVNSPRVKILFDIYHVQIMDGDICRNIQQNIQWIGHFHTGGVPGRHEIDDTQELNYRFIARTIVDSGFTGYLAHEYRPAEGRDPIRSLNQALGIMDV